MNSNDKSYIPTQLYVHTHTQNTQSAYLPHILYFSKINSKALWWFSYQSPDPLKELAPYTFSFQILDIVSMCLNWHYPSATWSGISNAYFSVYLLGAPCNCTKCQDLTYFYVNVYFLLICSTNKDKLVLL